MNDPNAYVELQRSVPGLLDMYSEVSALLSKSVTRGSRVLISGAGGGRELQLISDLPFKPEITAIDPSVEKLDAAKQAARRLGLFELTSFHACRLEAFEDSNGYDLVLSLLVLHAIKDETAKLDYLKKIRALLKPEGVLVHADIVVDSAQELKNQIERYRTYAHTEQVSPELVQFEIDAVSDGTAITSSSLLDLFREANLGAPALLNKALWYRCFITRPEV